MKCCISVVCVLSAFVAVTLAAPATLDESALAPVHNQVKRQAADNSEALNRIISFSNSKLQMLRQLCPQLFQVIDNVIQNVTSQVFRVVGGALLRSGGLGGGGSSGGASVGGRVSVVLPTFPPDEDEDDDDDEEEEDLDIRNRSGDIGGSISDIGGSISLNISASTSAPNALSANVPVSTNDNEVDNDVSRVSSSTTIIPVTVSAPNSTATTVASTITDGTTEMSTTDDGLTTTVVNAPEPFTSPSLENNNIKRHVRIARAAEEDQEVAASGGNGPNPVEDDLSNVDADDADRNKRYLPFGGDGNAAGGSGNFLFDLIRNTADRAARTVGTVYRMVAGTENLGFGITATSTSSKTVAARRPQLVAGSGATEQSDEQDAGIGGVAEVDVAPKDAHGEGIPGPITRLLVIANRGIANLIQDLILRLAQTSERIVNFKARLVTALI